MLTRHLAPAAAVAAALGAVVPASAQIPIAAPSVPVPGPTGRDSRCDRADLPVPAANEGRPAIGTALSARRSTSASAFPPASEGPSPAEPLEPRDADFGVGAMIALPGLVLLFALVAGVRALRRREGPVD